jgi:starch phosphorylase
MINKDPLTNHAIKVVFLPNYRVTLAEIVIPAADVSEQISTAGYEASGTGNMKFALNGALTVGTLDGANIEIKEEVGEANIFIFGLTVDEVKTLRSHYNPREYYENDQLLKRVIDFVRAGFFSPEEPEMFHHLVDYLLNNDPYLILADFGDYRACQELVGAAYRDRERWIKMAIRNVARIGRFSSDRAICEYNERIWRAKPLKIPLPDSAIAHRITLGEQDLVPVKG